MNLAIETQESKLPMDRVEKALFLVDRQGLGLEIGPSHSPIAPKRDGFNVHVVDYLSAPELREKFKTDHVDLDAIEDVDYVWRGEPLPELVGGEHSYDWIIASHVIEHLPDPIAFFAGCERVLRPDGVLSLIVPDKRYCFDHFRSVSTTGELLDAFEEHRTRPTPGSVFDHVVNSTMLDTRICWLPNDRGELALIHPFTDAQDLWEHGRKTGDYLDAHIWRFVPESFRLVIQDLQKLGLISLHIEKEFETAGHEFYVTLGVGPRTSEEVDRFQLMREVRDAQVPTFEAADPPSTDAISMEISELEQRLILMKRRILEVLRGRG